MPRVLPRMILALSILAVAVGCGGKQEQQQTQAETAAPAPSMPALHGPQIVQDMVVAHGGLEKWRSAPAMSFTDMWGDPGQGRQSTVVVEQSTRRVYIDMPGTETSLAWDGGKAWSVNWPSQTPVRFLALLNYYFINLPWLTQDPGVNLDAPGTGRLRGDETEYVTVMMTFDPGTGDTPDDYYRLYIDPTTKLLKACDYVVTYRALMGEGETSSPEHCLVYDEMTAVDGLTLPAHFTIYEGDSLYAACTVSDVSFSRPFDESRMTMPEGAVVDTSTP